MSVLSVNVGRFGLPAQVEAADPMHTDEAARHLLTAYLNVLAEAWRGRLETRMTQACNARGLARLRFSSGPSAGRYLVDQPDGEQPSSMIVNGCSHCGGVLGRKL